MSSLQLFLAMVPGLLGLMAAAVTYGALRKQVQVNAENLKEMENKIHILIGNSSGDPFFIRRSECRERTTGMNRELGHIKGKVDQQRKDIKGLQNFARWVLTVKEGMSPIEAEVILQPEN